VTLRWPWFALTMPNQLVPQLLPHAPQWMGVSAACSSLHHALALLAAFESMQQHMQAWTGAVVEVQLHALQVCIIALQRSIQHAHAAVPVGSRVLSAVQGIGERQSGVRGGHTSPFSVPVGRQNAAQVYGRGGRCGRNAWSL